MRSFADMRSIVRFLRAEEAVTSVEYAVMLAAGLLVALAAIQLFGNKTGSMWSRIATQSPS